MSRTIDLSTDDDDLPTERKLVWVVGAGGKLTQIPKEVAIAKARKPARLHSPELPWVPSVEYMIALLKRMTPYERQQVNQWLSQELRRTAGQ